MANVGYPPQYELRGRGSVQTAPPRIVITDPYDFPGIHRAYVEAGGGRGVSMEINRQLQQYPGAGQLYNDWYNVTFPSHNAPGWLTRTVTSLFGPAAPVIQFLEERSQTEEIEEREQSLLRLSQMDSTIPTSNPLPAGDGTKPQNSAMPPDKTPEWLPDPKSLRPDFSPLMLMVIGLIAVFFLFRR
jgi:hypothetical protein